MKKLILITLFSLGILTVSAQQYSFPMREYSPTPENLEAREEFRDMRFGLFVHWGIYSVMGDGEWVMFNQKIPFDTYKRLADFFNPQEFDAK